MSNSLLHIGLHIFEDDLQNFYKNVLNCEPIRSFKIISGDTFSIFGIKQEVIVNLVSCGDIELELFAGEKIETPTFGHICFKSTEAEKINEKAKEKGYSCYTRKRNSKESYFIRDRNNNLFEIKKIAINKN